MAYDFDLFTIGAGSGGVRASRLAGAAGAKVGVAEEFRIGGTCVVRGCVPKKFLVYASEYRQGFKDAAGYGWAADNLRFDWATLRDNVARDIARLSAAYASNMSKAGVQIFEERAEIVDPHSVRLMKSGRVVTAERILVATGGRPSRPLDTPGQSHAITSDDAFSLPALPRRAVVVGGGYIACEFAAIFQGLGVETVQVYRGSQVLRGFDDDIRAHVHAELERSGIIVKCGENIAAIEQVGGAYRVLLTGGEVIETDLVLLAVGRAPYTEGLGLARAGVKLEKNGAIIVDAFSQTNVPSIYAVGDVTDRINLTPVAIREGQAFAETVYMGKETKFDHTDVATAVFTRPSVGVVGCNEAEARKRHGPIDIYKATFRPMKHVLAGNEQRALMKLIVRQHDDVVVGVHIASPDAAEMIQLAAVAVKAGLTKAQWDSACAVHPTIAEELVTLKEKVRDPVAGKMEVTHLAG
jgi:glutathione reductase (NADPH)